MCINNALYLTIEVNMSDTSPISNQIKTSTTPLPETLQNNEIPEIKMGKMLGRKMAALVKEHHLAINKTANKVKDSEVVSIKNKPPRPSTPAPKFDALRLKYDLPKNDLQKNVQPIQTAYSKQLELLGPAPTQLQLPESLIETHSQVASKQHTPSSPLTPKSFPGLLRQQASKNEKLPVNTVGHEFVQVEVKFNKNIEDLKEVGRRLMPHIAADQKGANEARSFFRAVDKLAETSDRLIAQLATVKTEADIANVMKEVDLKVFKPVVDELEKLTKQASLNPQLFAALDDLAQKLGYNGFNDLSLRPTQKLMRYPLIMAEMSRKAPIDHPIHEALNKVKGDADYVNKPASVEAPKAKKGNFFSRLLSRFSKKIK